MRRQSRPKLGRNDIHKCLCLTFFHCLHLGSQPEILKREKNSRTKKIRKKNEEEGDLGRLCAKLLQFLSELASLLL